MQILSIRVHNLEGWLDTHFCNDIRIYFFLNYDCNKRYKTLEHLQIYFDSLCEMSSWSDNPF